MTGRTSQLAGFSTAAHISKLNIKKTESAEIHPLLQLKADWGANRNVPYFPNSPRINKKQLTNKHKCIRHLFGSTFMDHDWFLKVPRPKTKFLTRPITICGISKLPVAVYNAHKVFNEMEKFYFCLVEFIINGVALKVHVSCYHHHYHYFHVIVVNIDFCFLN